MIGAPLGMIDEKRLKQLVDALYHSDDAEAEAEFVFSPHPKNGSKIKVTLRVSAAVSREFAAAIADASQSLDRKRWLAK